MNLSTVDKIANAVLYEGYILYPHRASSRKNRQRFTFGRVYPEAYSRAQGGAEPSLMQTECLLRALARRPTLGIRVRFLHPTARTIGLLSAPVSALPPDINLDSFSFVPELRIDDKLYQAWEEAVERTVRSSHQLLPRLADRPMALPFHFSSSLTFDPIFDRQSRVVGAIVRRQQALQGTIHIAAQKLTGEVFKIRVTIENQPTMPTPDLSQPE